MSEKNDKWEIMNRFPNQPLAKSLKEFIEYFEGKEERYRLRHKFSRRLANLSFFLAIMTSLILGGWRWRVSTRVG